MTATPIVRHLKLHEEAERAGKVAKKKKGKNNNNHVLYAASLTQAMKDSFTISKGGLECREKLPRNLRYITLKTLLSEAAPEAQTNLYKNLKRYLLNKINLEKSEQKKKQLFKDLKNLEFIYTVATEEVTGKPPIGEPLLSSHASSLVPETNQATNVENNVLPRPIPDANITSVTGNLTTHEMNEHVPMEIISMAPAAIEEAIKYTSLIAENEIKSEINNE